MGKHDWIYRCLSYVQHHIWLDFSSAQFVNIGTTAHRFARGTARGDCIIPLRKSTFSQSAFSAKAALERNSIPATIRELDTSSLFRAHLRKWFISTPSVSSKTQLHLTDLSLSVLKFPCRLPLLVANIAIASLPSCTCMHVFIVSDRFMHFIYCACFLRLCFRFS